jgi:hypothetical protein
MKTVLSVIFGVVLSSVAIADTTVHIGETGYLRSGGGNVLIFASQSAMSKALELRKAGADTSLITQYIACMVSDGTKVLNINGEVSGAFIAASAALATSR